MVARVMCIGSGSGGSELPAVLFGKHPAAVTVALGVPPYACRLVHSVSPTVTERILRVDAMLAIDTAEMAKRSFAVQLHAEH